MKSGSATIALQAISLSLCNTDTHHQRDLFNDTVKVTSNKWSLNNFGLAEKYFPSDLIMKNICSQYKYSFFEPVPAQWTPKGHSLKHLSSVG